jgi:mRNA-degrading endonuclease RelE of RelBE toxin-antitoxin system
VSPRPQIYLVPSAEKAWRGLDGKTREAIKNVLRQAYAAGPHQHSGTGLRRLSNGFHEARLGLGMRIVFFMEPDAATIYLIGSHDDVSDFVNNRPRRKKGWHN